MVLPDGRVESCGNFHGAPLAFACDFLAIAAAEVGAIAERRTDRLLDADALARAAAVPHRATPGVNSGLMIAQYTQAAMVAENRRLAAPASVDSLPTSAMQEDHVSMGWGAARKLRAALAQPRAHPGGRAGLRRARPRPARAAASPGRARGAALAAVRARVAGPGPDRWLAPELAAAEELVGSGALVARGRSRAIGALRMRAGPRSARQRALLPRLAAGGRAADADEQPRPGGRRAPRRPRRLRRHRPRGALLGGVRRDRPRRCARWRTTRRCSCSRASRSACSARTSGRRAC